MVSVRPTFLIGSTLIFVAFCGSDILNRSTKVVAAVMSRIFFGQSRSLPWLHWMDCYSTVKHCGMRRMTRLVLVASLCLFFGGRLHICAMVKRWIICLYLNILYILSMYLIYNMYNTYIYIYYDSVWLCLYTSIHYIHRDLHNSFWVHHYVTAVERFELVRSWFSSASLRPCTPWPRSWFSGSTVNVMGFMEINIDYHRLS